MRKITLIALGIALVYEDLSDFLYFCVKGRLKFDSALLLSPEVKKDFVIHLLKNHNKSLLVYGNKRIDCTINEKIIPTNNIVFVFVKNSICITDPKDLFNIFATKINIPIYSKLLGFYATHFELIGNEFKLEYTDKGLKSLELGSTIIIATSDFHLLDDIFLNLVTELTNIQYNNPYIKYTHYILKYPSDSKFIIQTGNGIKVFESKISKINNLDTISIDYWQKVQVKNFDNFINKYGIVNTKYLMQYNELTSFPEETSHNANQFRKNLLFASITQNDAKKVSSYDDTFNFVSVYAKITPLYLAVHLGYIEIVEFLIHSKINLNEQIIDGRTALHASVLRGSYDITLALCTKGADVNIASIKGDTPIILATYNNFAEVVKLLLNYGANPVTKNNNGISALDTAIVSYNHELVSLFKDNIQQQEFLFSCRNNPISDTFYFILQYSTDPVIVMDHIENYAIPIEYKNQISQCLSSLSSSAYCYPNLLECFLAYQEEVVLLPF
jgi:hypothetical protein